jgi:hypothetical protein
MRGQFRPLYTRQGGKYAYIVYPIRGQGKGGRGELQVRSNEKQVIRRRSKKVVNGQEEKRTFFGSPRDR